MTDDDRTARFREGAGRLSLDLVRTLCLRGEAGETEELATVSDLRAWVDQLGPVGPGRDAAPRAGETDRRDSGLLDDARALREAVHVLVELARTGEPVVGAPHAVRTVDDWAARPVPVPRIDDEGRLAWAAEDPVRATLALVARDAVELVTSPLAARVRRCEGTDCGALFLDASRPGTRRWCSMGTCGNRAKKAAFRDRAAVAAV